MNLKEIGASAQDFKLAELVEMIVERGGPAHFQTAHHHKRNRVAKRVRFVVMFPQQSDGLLVVLTRNFRQMHQSVLPKILDDLFPNRPRARERGMDFRKDQWRRDELRSFLKQASEDFASAFVVSLFVISKRNPERGVDEYPISVDHRLAFSASLHSPFIFTYFLGAP